MDPRLFEPSNEPPFDINSPDDFRQMVSSKFVTDKNVETLIYSTHDVDMIRSLTGIYVDYKIESGKVKGEDRDNFIQTIFSNYELNYNEALFPGKSYGVMKRTFDKVKKQLSQPVQNTFINVQSSINEDVDGMYITKEKGSKRITSFTIRPVYTVSYETETLEEQVTTEGFGVFEIVSKHRISGKETRSRIELRSYNFHTVSSFRETLRDKKIHGTFVYGSDYEIAQLGEYLFFEVNTTERTGINSIGIKRLESGKSVIVTPKKVYDTMGNEQPQMVYVRDEVISITEVMKLQGMTYDEDAWSQKVLPLLMENFLSLHKRSTMLTILGWAMSIPFETIVRLDGNAGGFPHLMISGVNGAGKTGVISSLMPYLGYGTEPEISNFGTQFANEQAIGTSHHVPVAFDEYRPYEWQQSLRNSVEKFLRQSYNRGFHAKGQKDLSTRRFDYRNPIIIIGQMATSDQAIAERVIPVYFDVNFLKTLDAKIAKETFHLLNNAADKMFWAGFLIWCAKQDSKEVLAVYEDAKESISVKFQHLKEREIVNYAVVSLGLYYFKKLADEFKLDCHYTEEEIYNVVDTITEHAEVTLGDKMDDLWRFLEDMKWYGSTYGNSKGEVFGNGKTVMLYQPVADKKDVYGKDSDKKAEVRGRKLLLIKTADAIKTLKSVGITNKYDEKMLMPIVMSHFQSTQLNNGEGLILAPQGYRVAGGRYTAFNWDDVNEMFGFIEELQGDANVRHSVLQLVREIKQEEGVPVSYGNLKA